MRNARKPITVMVAVLGVLAFASAPAFAATGYIPAGSFGEKGPGVGQFNEPGGVAINDSTGDVYVYDAGNRRVEWFNSTGSAFEGQFNGSGAFEVKGKAETGAATPTGQFTPPVTISETAAHGTLFNLAVDNDAASLSTGDIYVVDPGHNVIDKFSATGAYLSQLTGFSLPIFGVTVDSSGNLWVAEEGTEEAGNSIGPVKEFDGSPANKPITEIKPEKHRSPGIAVDSEENLYIVKGSPQVVKFTHEGAFIQELPTCECVTGLAVDSSTNELLVDQGTAISRYGAFGTPFEETLEGISSSQGIAVNGTTHTLYATQREADKVAVFDLVPLPEVTTGPASKEQRTTVKLEGEVDPGGEMVTSCGFEYGTSTAYGQTAPCVPAPGSGASPVPVSAEVTGLTPQTTYHYRLLARNAHGPSAGTDHEFTTLPAVEGVLTDQASEVQGTTATLAGSLEPNGFDTHYFFEYGLSNSYGSTTANTDAGSATAVAPVSVPVGGLEPNQIYHYRIAAENTFGKTFGADTEFKTAVLPPLITGASSASFVTSQSAVLNASLNPEHTTTRYHFEFGACPAIAGCATLHSTTDEASSLFGTIGATMEIVGLAPQTTYSYRLIASNRHIASCEGGNPLEEEGVIVRCEEGGTPVFAGGEAIGAESTFTTSTATIVQAATGPASSVTATSAIISGAVNADGQPATYTFELGVYQGSATQYGVVSSGPTGAETTAVGESMGLSGLQPGVTYAYKIVIRSGYGTAEGQPVTFTTAGLPSVLTSPVTSTLLATPAIAFPKEAQRPTTPRKLTRAQLFTRALKACAKQPKHKRAACRRHAEKRYGPPRRKK
jgi:hypothetical protein